MLRTFIILLLLIPLISKAQSTYDSLKEVYSAQHVFGNREKGAVTGYIKEALSKIDDERKKQLTICALTENLYGYGWVKDKELLGMIDKVIADPNTEEIGTLAQQIKAEVTRTLVNTKIQSISLADVDGNMHRLEDYYSGKDFVVVDLWATWCGPCIAEMKKFNTLREQYKNIEFYSISLDEDFSRLQRFIARNKSYTWPIVWAGKDSPLSGYFKARLIPAFVIVDKNGMIISHVVGKGLEDELKKINR